MLIYSKKAREILEAWLKLLGVGAAYVSWWCCVLTLLCNGAGACRWNTRFKRCWKKAIQIGQNNNITRVTTNKYACSYLGSSIRTIVVVGLSYRNQVMNSLLDWTGLALTPSWTMLAFVLEGPTSKLRTITDSLATVIPLCPRVYCSIGQNDNRTVHTTPG